MTESKNTAQDTSSSTDDKKKENVKSAAPAGGAGKSGKTPARKPAGKRVIPVLLVLLLLLAIALGGFVWYQHTTHHRIIGELTSQAQRSTTAAQQAGKLSRQAQAEAQAQAERVSHLQATVESMDGQIQDLGQALQMATDSGSELILLNDIDHLVSIANQQLLLSGNVANALVALETAQARLARANRPALASLQQTLNGDIDRLRAVSTIDVSALSRQLEQLNGLVGQAPLLIPDVAVLQADTQSGRKSATLEEDTALSAPDPNASWLEQSWDSTVHWSRQAWSVIQKDLAAFMDIRRVDNEASLLISPDQATQLRQTLRLRIMTAQLAVMMGQPDIWQAELESVLNVLETYFNDQSMVTQRALRLATRLIDTPVDASLPTLDNTFEAIKVLRNERTQSITQADQTESNAGNQAGRAQ